MSPNQLDIAMLGLRGKAYQAAHMLRIAHPDAVITSGLRNRHEQALAMAHNIVRGGRDWIKNTYKASKPAKYCQDAIDAHPEMVDPVALADLLYDVLALFTDEELAALSKHLSGDAFDVKPIDGWWGGAILETLRQIVRDLGGKLITNEGGITVWHLQF